MQKEIPIHRFHYKQRDTLCTLKPLSSHKFLISSSFTQEKLLNYLI